MTISSQQSRAACITTVAEGYERWAAFYDDSPNPLLAREERYLAPLLGDVRKRTILDLACGTGRWMARLANGGAESCVGIDFSGAMLEAATRKPSVEGHVVRGTCESLPFKEDIFHLAICSFALGHFAEVGSFTAEMSRVCKSGADVFITDLHPSAHEMGWRVGFRDQTATAIEIENDPRNPEEIRAAFSDQGFTLMRWESLWLEESERAIFARAGRGDRFEKACSVPAIITFQFRKSDGVADVQSS